MNLTDKICVANMADFSIGSPVDSIPLIMRKCSFGRAAKLFLPGHAISYILLLVEYIYLSQ